MKLPSTTLGLILLLLSLQNTDAFVALVVAPCRTLSRTQVGSTMRRPSALRPLGMVKSVSSFQGKMKLAGPLATLGLSFPQLGDLSIKNIQRVGETAFGAMVLIAAIQGILIIHQYSTNPAGELIVPPGLTFGTEDATRCDENSDPCAKLPSQKRKEIDESLQVIDELIRTNNGDSVGVNVKKGWYHVNRLLVLFIPLAIEQFGFAAMKYSHLLHLAVIMGLVHIYDFFQRLPDAKEGIKISDEPEFSEKPHVIVLGDSMGVGIGCVNEFDPEKNSGILQRIEQTDPKHRNDGFGPVFPRILARTLSSRLNRPVSWRSAGVDGGDAVQIRDLLLPVVQEEVNKGKLPDIVVILTGANDLKRIIQSSEAGERASVRGFRANLIRLVQDIHAISPTTRVIFPAFPTYRLDNNSILNIFPLSIFLDGMIGFWEKQKKLVANRCSGAMHVDIKFKDVYDWYRAESNFDEGEPTLLAADGIHPNTKLYSRWAAFVANKIVDSVEAAEKRSSTTHTGHVFNRKRLGWEGPQ